MSMLIFFEANIFQANRPALRITSYRSHST